MQRTTIMLPEALKSRLEKKADDLNLSMGEIIRIASQEYLDRNSRPYLNDPLVSGDYIIREPGPGDVSANIDKYLYGGKGK